MMNLRSMVVGLDSDRVAKRLISFWEHDEGSVTFWRASSNFVYVFTNQEKTYFLRFSFEQDNSLKQILGELDFMNYLIIHDYPSVKPVRSTNDRLVESVKMDEGIYYGVVFTQADGRPLDMESMNETQFHHWGKSLAKLHSLSQTYQPIGEKRIGWQGILTFIRVTLQRYPSEQAAIVELSRMEAWLAALPQSDETFGFIHYDFQPDNLFWDEKANRFHVFDFDDSMYHWFAMDIVAALVDLLEDDGSLARERLHYFLNGYRSILPLDDEMVGHFPKFLRFHKLFGFCKILRSLENSEIEDAPPWYEGLKNKLQNISDQMRLGFQQPW